MKIVARMVVSACTLYVAMLVIAAGVFFGMQAYDFSQSHVLINIRQIERADGTPDDALQIYRTGISPLHKAVGARLYLIAVSAEKDAEGRWNGVESSKQVREGNDFVGFLDPNIPHESFIIVCSKTPLTSYEEVRSQVFNPYTKNFLWFGEELRGYQELECR